MHNESKCHLIRDNLISLFKTPNYVKSAYLWPTMQLDEY